MSEKVILVNEKDEVIGSMEKMQAHQEGLLHRAFSIFILDGQGRMLLQQRALTKYHSAGLWTNACCSHPRPGEETLSAANRRLKEELGFQTELKHVFTFTYETNFENGLTEHELDHVFFGEYNGELSPDPMEVMDSRLETPENIRKELIKDPNSFTSWFRIAFPKVEEWINHHQNQFSHD